ncbi:MAG TPA: alanine--tRNA ligase [Bacteroidetes bacterium]|nr:alanine--tRNA ligase [Candidatus Limimorpha avicola]
MKANEIRKCFLDFFKSKNHVVVPSAPIVVKNDPTLMFTNAGMNQFKDVFLGNKSPKAPRVADIQKCLRVSGKHNDLEEVGRDTYHHTMFEMMGNWSFGDYFKEEAIAWAWEFLTEVLKIDKERLYVTVFGGDPKDGLDPDNEAFTFWKKHIDESRIIYGSKKDNFWEMGDTGPCGPCSEIHIDIRSDEDRNAVNGKDLVNKDNPEVIEIWNLVFIQFNRLANGSLVNLPAKHVDTGMGFERLVRVMQNKKSNYDTDIFQPVIQTIAEMAGVRYGDDEQKDIAMRVVADHLRAVSFALSDGQLPSNNGAGYVIRRILRRAVRYGYTFLGFTEPFMYKLLPVLVDEMGEQYPELLTQQTLVSKVMHEEESSFLRTLSQGIRRFESYVEQNVSLKTIDGAFAFELFDTYGFPVDLTNLMAEEKGLSVDMESFSLKLEEQKNRSRKAAEKTSGDWVVLFDMEPSFVGYDTTQAVSKILRFREVTAKNKKHYEIVLDKTPFYAEMGGQVGDKGILSSEEEIINVVNTVKENDLIIHITDKLPQNPELPFTASVDVERRRKIEANHSATHLMHAALRVVLGPHVEQKGSLVDDERLRFDFSHFAKMTDEEIKKVESLVNMKIRENIKNVTTVDVPLEEAKNMGAMALFGEKYGDKVRVVSFDPSYSCELCGGTHVPATGCIGAFKILTESAIAAGVRRIEAVTGEEVMNYLDKCIDTVDKIKAVVKSSGDVVKAVETLSSNNQMLQKRVDALMMNMAVSEMKTAYRNTELCNGRKIVVTKVDADVNQLKNMAAALKDIDNDAVAILGGVTDNKPAICLLLPQSLVDASFDATAMIREVAKEIQGGGGGQKNLATAGGKNVSGLDKAMEMLKRHFV